MSITRRDFMKIFGVSVASLFMARCNFPATPTPTCYAPLPPSMLPAPTGGLPRERLRYYWLRFSELAEVTLSGGNLDNSIGQQLTAGHRATLDELIAAGNMSAPVADLVHEAYTAAVYHVWRSNAPITCYEPAMVDYAPTSADVLVRQSTTLSEIAAQGLVDPETLAKAQSALEHDLAFYALSNEDVQTLYDEILQAAQDGGRPVPSFDELQLELTPEARQAAQFIIDLLAGR